MRKAGPQVSPTVPRDGMTNMRIKPIILCALCCLPVLACTDDGPTEPPGTGDVSGVVTSSMLEGNPLQFAFVSIGAAGSWTGLDGEYVIKDVPVGNRVVRATRWDHQSYQATVSVTANEQTAHDIELIPLQAAVRFANGISGTTGTVQIGLEGDPYEQIAFKAVTEYRETTPGERYVEISDSSGEMEGGRVILVPGKRQTIAFFGPDRDSVSTWGIVLTDDPGSSGQELVPIRVVHASLPTGPVDLYLLEEGERPDGAALISGFDYVHISPYFTVAAGQFSLVLTKESAPDSVVFDSGPIPAPEGSAWTLLVIPGNVVPDAIDLIVMDNF